MIANKLIAGGDMSEWIPPQKEEVRAVCSEIGIENCAKIVRKHYQTIYRWCSVKSPQEIDYANWYLLCSRYRELFL